MTKEIEGGQPDALNPRVKRIKAGGPWALGCAISLGSGLVLLGPPSEAWAAGVSTWILPTDGFWFQPQNWNGGIPGVANAQTIINNGTAVQISGTEDANAGARLDISGSGSVLSVAQGRSLTFGTANLSNGAALGVTEGSIHGDVNLNDGVNGNKGSLIFSLPAQKSITYVGAISGGGTGDSTFAGLNFKSGTVVLKGASTYTGQTSIASGATVQVANLNALRNSVAILGQGAKLDFGGIGAANLGGLTNPDAGAANLNLGPTHLTVGYNNQSALYAGNISGSGSLTKTGSAEQVLAGNNTYTGGTTIQQGVLRIGNGGTRGSLAGNVVNNASLVFDRSDALSIAGNISGSGSLTKQGGGTLTLTGTNTYSGGTTVSAGVLAGTAASLQGDIANNGQVAFHQDSDGTYSGAMQGGGSLLKGGAGTLTLGGANTYTGSTTVSAGVLAGNATSLQGRILNNAQVSFHQDSDGTYNGVMSGSGKLLKDGAGTLTLAGTNTYSGGTTVSSGVLAGSTASLQGDIVNNGQVAFHQASEGTYGSIISGSGSLLKDGAGTLILTGANTYTGQTQVNQGGLVLGGGTKTFSGGFLNQGTVTAHGTTVGYGGDFVNNGAYVSQASDSQFNNLTVGPNGYLTGISGDQFIVKGDFRNTSALSKSWNTSRSNLVFSAPVAGQPAQHQMDLVGTDKGPGAQAAKKNFSWGSLRLEDGNSLALANGNANGGRPALYVGRLILDGKAAQLSSISSDYNIYYNGAIKANQYLLGQRRFGSGTGRLLPWGYNPEIANAFAAGAGPGLVLTPDQQSFALALDRSCAAPSGDLVARCQELQGLAPSQKLQAVQKLTPDQVPAQTALTTQFRSNRLAAPMIRLAGLRHGNSAPLALSFDGINLALGGGAAGDEPGAAASEDSLRDPPLGAFIQGRLDFGSMDQNAASRGYNYQSRNVTFGADYRFTDKLVAGLLFTYINTDSTYDQNSGGLNGNSYTGAAYGSLYLPADFFVDWAASYGGQDYTFSRQYSYPGFVGQARSQPGGQQFGFALNAGRDFAWEGWQFSPYTRFEYSNLHIDAYHEKGGNGFDLAVGGQTAQSFVSDLGLQVSHAFSLPWAVLTPGLRVEWEHQYLNDNRLIQMTLMDAAPGAGNFLVQTGNPDRDYVNLGGSVVATLPNGGSGFLRYESRLGQSDIAQHTVEFGLRMAF
jgi:autotransporter-associated beta strand protein